MRSRRNLLFTLSFIEGASVMACELFSAKLIAPFFGGSLYVWAAVLGVTLSALMLGYYFGGYISEKSKRVDLVFWILLAAGLLLAIMPYTSFWSMTYFIDYSVQSGSTFSLIIFMFPPLFLMGTTSPIIINLINTSVELTGKSAGSVYAISTLGGIFATFLVGFYLLPEFGIKWPCFFFGLVLAAIPVVLLFKKYVLRIAAIVILFGLISFKNFIPKNYTNKDFQIVYESEGVLGQIKVIDMYYPTATRGLKKGRALMVNNTIQTIMDLENPEYDLWDWSIFFPTAASIYPPGSDALLLGLGGGTLVQQFNRLGFNLDVVELDERVVSIAKEYFFIDPTTNIFIDDARRFINTCDKKYDVITLDLFLNETPPAHVLTLESFQKIKNLLKPNGMIMMNFYGYITGEKGRAARCIQKTLEAAGLYTEIVATPGLEENRNLIFLAAVNKKDFSQTNYQENKLVIAEPFMNYFLDSKTFEQNGIILNDNCPALEKIYLPAALAWRRGSIDYNVKKFIDFDSDLLK